MFKKVFKKFILSDTEEEVIIDKDVADWIEKDETLREKDFTKKLKKNNSGEVFFQETQKTSENSIRNETIYLKDLIFGRFLKKEIPKESKVEPKNGNQLDYRIDNLEIKPGEKSKSRFRKKR